MPVQARARLGLRPDHQLTGLRHPLCEPSHLTLEVGPLVVRGDSRIEAKADCRGRRGGVDVHQNGARPRPPCGHRQGAVLKPPELGVGMDALAARPPSQVHKLFVNTHMPVLVGC
jgi:hypothetical protein